jgi:hypothetical protein
MKVPSRRPDTRFASSMSLRWKDRLDGTIPKCAEISPADNPCGPATTSTRKIANRDRCAMALKASMLLSSSIPIARRCRTSFASARHARAIRTRFPGKPTLPCRLPQAIHPPSTVRLSPLVKLASELARYDTAAAISSGFPNRPTLASLVIVSWSSVPGWGASSVSIGPG